MPDQMKIDLPYPDGWSDSDVAHGQRPYVALSSRDGEVWFELHNGEEAIEAVMDLSAMSQIAYHFGLIAGQTHAEIKAFKQRGRELAEGSAP